MLDLKKSAIFFVLLFIFIIPKTIYGFFYNIAEWSNGQQSLFLFSDLHGDTPNNAIPHRIELINAAKAMNAFVIVEDAPDIQHFLDLTVNYWKERGLIDICCGSFFVKFFEDLYIDFKTNLLEEKLKINSNINIQVRVNPSFDPNADYSFLLPSEFLESINPHVIPLPFLTQCCKQRGIPTYNVEFRLTQSRLQDMLTRYQNEIIELKTYDDGQILNAFYEKVSQNIIDAEITKLLPDIFINFPNLCGGDLIFNGCCSSYNKDFEKLFDCYPNEIIKIDPFLTKRKPRNLFMEYGTFLIDARILHCIKNRFSTNIFVCAGGLHIERISKILPQIGFKLIREIGDRIEDYYQERSHEIICLSEYFKKFHVN